MMKGIKLIIDDTDNNEKNVAEKKECKIISNFETDTAPKKVRIQTLVLFWYD